MRENFPNRKKSGVQVPDTLVTINDVDSYKVLDAPNIDWDEYLMKWTNLVYKFKSDGNLTPEDGENPLNNKDDWYTPHAEFNGGTKPDWTNGVIKESDQVLDMIDYLMWRIANIDYFCDNWNLRDSKKASVYICCQSDKVNYPDFNWANVDGISSSDFLGAYLKAKLNDLAIEVKLLPSISASVISTTLRDPGYNFSTLIKADLVANNYYGNTFYFLSTSNGNLSIDNKSSNIDGNDDVEGQKIVPVILPNTEMLNTINDPTGDSINNGERYYVVEFPIEVYGTTSWFYNAQSMLNAIYTNMNSTIKNGATGDIPSKTNLNDYYIDQKEETYSFSIRQNPSQINGVQYGESVTGVRLHVFKSDINVSLKIGDMTDNVSISFYNEALNETTGNKYAITIIPSCSDFSLLNESTYKDYGLFPYFFITDKNHNRQSLSDGAGFTYGGNNEFNSFTSKYGEVRYENGGYYYIPPVESNFNLTSQEELDGKEILIHCFLYYKDGTDSSGNHPRVRAFTPGYTTIKVLLRKREQNRIIFLGRAASRPKAYRYSRTAKTYQQYSCPVANAIDGSSIFIDPDRIYYASDSEHFDYAVKDLYFDPAAFPTNNSQETPSTILINDIVTNIATSVWSDNIKVDFLGVRGQNSMNDNLGVYDTTNMNFKLYSLDANGDKDVNTFIQKEIKQERFYRLGYNNGYFDYVDDSSVFDYDIDLSEQFTKKADNVTENFLSVSKLLNNVKYNSLGTANNQTKYGRGADVNLIIHKSNADKYSIEFCNSSAVFDNENGLVSSSNLPTITNTMNGNDIQYSGKIYNADTDYYYLVFKIYCTDQVEEQGGKTFTKCEAYYFVRILRNKKQFLLSFEENKTINYTLTANDQNIYSMKTITRSPIYLNRLLTSNAFINNKDMLGKQYWYFYGTNPDELTSNTWNNKIVSIDNSFDYYPDGVTKNTKAKTEDYIYIFNEGDKYKYNASGYSSKVINTNPNYINSENDLYIDLSSNSERTVKHIDETTSGPFIYINKLMRMEDVLPTSDTDDPFVRVESSSININVGVIVGNSNKYERVKSSGYGSINISKRIYDITLYKKLTLANNTIYNEFISTNTNPLELMYISNDPAADENNPESENYDANTCLFNNANQQTTPYASMMHSKVWSNAHSFDNSSDAEDKSKILILYLCSNELGNTNNVIGTGDPLIMDNQGKFQFNNNVDINTSIRLDNLNTQQWIIDSNFIPFNSFIPNKIATAHLVAPSGSSQSDYNGNIIFYGTDYTTNPIAARFIIDSDDCGVYDQKNIVHYFVVK